MNNRPKRQEEETIGSFYMGRMRRATAPPKRVMPRGALTFLTVIFFAIIIWYAYPQGEEQQEGSDIPLIRADASAYKFPPDDPGGIEIRHQDSTIFDPLEKKGEEEVGNVLPETEAPMQQETVLFEGAAETPQLNLEPQMRQISEETEKIIFPNDKKEETKPDGTETPPVTVVKPVRKGESKPVATTPKKDPAKDVVWDVYIRLGSFRNISGAKEEWLTMLRRYPSQLRGLNMRIVQVNLGQKGIYNRLEAGKMPETKAREICKIMAEKNPGGCIVVK